MIFIICILTIRWLSVKNYIRIQKAAYSCELLFVYSTLKPALFGEVKQTPPSPGCFLILTSSMTRGRSCSSLLVSLAVRCGIGDAMWFTQTLWPCWKWLKVRGLGNFEDKKMYWLLMRCQENIQKYAKHQIKKSSQQWRLSEDWSFSRILRGWRSPHSAARRWGIPPKTETSTDVLFPISYTPPSTWPMGDVHQRWLFFPPPRRTLHSQNWWRGARCGKKKSHGLPDMDGRHHTTCSFSQRWSRCLEPNHLWVII